MRSTFIKGTSSSSSSSRMLRMLRMICQSLSTSSTTSIMRSTFIRRTSSSSSSSRPAKCRPDPKFKWKRLAKLRPIIYRWQYRQSVGQIRSINWNLERPAKLCPPIHRWRQKRKEKKAIAHFRGLRSTSIREQTQSKI